jgi:hypothetical protein
MRPRHLIVALALAGLMLSACGSNASLRAPNSGLSKAQRATLVHHFQQLCENVIPGGNSVGADGYARFEVGGYSCVTGTLYLTQLDIFKSSDAMNSGLVALEGGNIQEDCFVVGGSWLVYFDESDLAHGSTVDEVRSIQAAMGGGRFVSGPAGGGCPGAEAVFAGSGTSPSTTTTGVHKSGGRGADSGLSTTTAPGRITTGSTVTMTTTTHPVVTTTRPEVTTTTVSITQWIGQFRSLFNQLESNYSAGTSLDADVALLDQLNSMVSNPPGNSVSILGNLITNYTFLTSDFPGQCTPGAPPSSANCASFITGELAAVQSDLNALPS